jgi:hypothetical protein
MSAGASGIIVAAAGAVIPIQAGREAGTFCRGDV